MYRLSVRRTFGDRVWSIIVIGIFTVGLTTSTVIESTNLSLGIGLSTYSSAVATYIYIQPSSFGSTIGNEGSLQSAPKIPAQYLAILQSIPQVERVYPMVLNYSYFLFSNLNVTGNGEGQSISSIVAGIPSAVIGGPNGFPVALIDLSGGMLPTTGNPQLVWNSAGVTNFATKAPYRVGDTFDVGFVQSSPGNFDIKFNATVVGVTKYNPMLVWASALWDQTFLKATLGSSLYNQTFGGEPNFVILKARTLADVPLVANQTATIVKHLGGFTVMYDQEAVASLQSFQAQTEPLYLFVGILSAALTAIVISFVVYLATGKRRWEGGLLIVQGWTWSMYSRLLLYQYLTLSIISSAISIPISVITSSLIVYHFEVFGSTLAIPVHADPVMLAATFPIASIFSCLAVLVAVGRLRRTGLDEILRDY